MIEFAPFIQWVFYGLMSFVGIYGVKILGNMKTSIEKLNVSMAVIIERNAWHQREIDDIRAELRKLKK